MYVEIFKHTLNTHFTFSKRVKLYDAVNEPFKNVSKSACPLLLLALTITITLLVFITFSFAAEASIVVTWDVNYIR